MLKSYFIKVPLPILLILTVLNVINLSLINEIINGSL
jgi:hypothetical protein